MLRQLLFSFPVVLMMSGGDHRFGHQTEKCETEKYRTPFCPIFFCLTFFCLVCLGGRNDDRSLMSLSAQVAGQDNKIPDQAREILKNASQLELLSIGHDATPKNPAEDFRGWPVIGKTTITDPDTRNRLVAALEKGVEENKGDSMKCFNPRHGVRVTHDGMTADFVICFECFQVVVYVGGGKQQRFLITDSPASVFNQTLRYAKVPLAREPGRKR